MKKVLIAFALTVAAVATAAAFDFPEHSAFACNPADKGCEN